jgi:hypothetical protein
VLAVFETLDSAVESYVVIRETSIIQYGIESKSSAILENELPILMLGSAL